MTLFADIAAYLFLIPVGVTVGIVAHEAGHCAFAAVASLPVTYVRIGIGAGVAHRRLGGIELHLHALPLGGYVGVAADGKTARLRIAVFTLGGIAANAMLLGLAAWLLQADALPSLPRTALAGFALVQFALLVGSLIPMWGRVNGIPFPNDGLQIVLLMRRRHSIDAYRSYEQVLGHYTPGRPPQTTDASSVLRAQLARPLWVDANARRDMLDALRRELKKDVMSPEERMLILNVLISLALISRDPIFYPHLDGWASRLAELGPGVASLASTRGGVLVELGQFAAGKAALDAVAKPEFAAADPFEATDWIMTQAFIARAEGALGNPRAGRSRLVRAREAIRANASFEVLRPLIERIDRELLPGPYQAPASTSISASRSGMSTITS